MEPGLIECLKTWREMLQRDADRVRALMGHVDLVNDIPVPELNKPEARANIMLAFRHLEDARMRLGKAIQAAEGGVSKYDTKPK